MKLYNTLTKRKDDFYPLRKDRVTMYICGPTVYDYAHIGNFRYFVSVDVLVRALRYFKYNLITVMNITDVGHLVSDADAGEDKLEKGARREGKTAWDVAAFYEKAFLSDYKKLNIMPPNHMPKPTELIREQIQMIQVLERKGFTYVINDGVYFDTEKLDDYGKLTGQSLDDLLAGARVEINKEKKSQTDFALWKLSPKGKKRDMEWESPWGVGFPGWHIECSVMSQKFLGDQIDIHTGGIDHIPVHHTNEIAQSEAATGKSPFSRWWVHVAFMSIKQEKMSKSTGNFYTVGDLEKHGFDPMSLRYFYLSAHYRSSQDFTLEALGHASNGLSELRDRVVRIKEGVREEIVALSDEGRKFLTTFEQSLKDDVNIAQALAVVWKVVKSSISDDEKLQLVKKFDSVYGLNLLQSKSRVLSDVPDNVQKLVDKRESLRRKKQFKEADDVRGEIESLGYVIEDTSGGVVVKQK